MGRGTLTAPGPATRPGPWPSWEPTSRWLRAGAWLCGGAGVIALGWSYGRAKTTGRADPLVRPRLVELCGSAWDPVSRFGACDGLLVGRLWLALSLIVAGGAAIAVGMISPIRHPAWRAGARAAAIAAVVLLTLAAAGYGWVMQGFISSLGNA